MKIVIDLIEILVIIIFIIIIIDRLNKILKMYRLDLIEFKNVYPQLFLARYATEYLIQKAFQIIKIFFLLNYLFKKNKIQNS